MNALNELSKTLKAMGANPAPVSGNELKINAPLINEKTRETMRKTKLKAELNGVQYAVYTSENERLYIKMGDQFIYIYNPELIKNNVRILQEVKTK